MFGPAAVPHSCGHVVYWTSGDTDAISWLRFCQAMYRLPCPWCGGETGSARAELADEILYHSGPPELGTLTASKIEPS